METDVALVLGIICVLIIILLTFLAFLVYCGLFATIDIKAGKPPFQELEIAYKFCRGPYKNSGGLFTEVHSLTPSLKCIGVYYDDPDDVEPMRLRFLVGAVLNDSECPATKEDREKLEAEGFRTATFPPVDNVISTTFPFRGSVSVILAVARVYPQLKDYIKERHLCAHPFLEIYEVDRVLFICPLAKQDEFYVDEALEDPEEGATSDQGATSEDHEEDTTVSNEPPSPVPGPTPTSIPAPVPPPVPQIPPVAPAMVAETRVQTVQPSNGGTPPEESDHASRSSTASSFEELRLDANSN